MCLKLECSIVSCEWGEKVSEVEAILKALGLAEKCTTFDRS